MTDKPMTLPELSAAAIASEQECPIRTGRVISAICPKCKAGPSETCIPMTLAYNRLGEALVNAYRTDQLVDREGVAGAVEALGEALHGLSAMLLLIKALDDDKTHTAYEKVVERFAALARKAKEMRS